MTVETEHEELPSFLIDRFCLERNTVATGEIKRLETEQGIGFIRETGVDEEIFFHAAALTEGTFDRLSEGQRVEFDRKAYGNAPSKSRAINVRPVRQFS